MKYFSFLLIALFTGATSEAAITVMTPGNNAQVNQTFNLVAHTDSCSSTAAVSMGYSIDNGPTTIVHTSFSANVTAPLGNHILHVKCWGVRAAESMPLKINVVSSGGQSSVATPAFSPAGGAYSSTQSVSLSDATPGATIFYTTDGSAPTPASAQYSGPISVSRNAVIEAVAIASGYTASGLARADYTISTKSTGANIPDSAIADRNLERLDKWRFNHDPATPGTSNGDSRMVDTPSVSGSARQFASSFTHAGGEIYHITFARDTVSKNFVYDAWVWIEAGSDIANLEMDSNQVTANGDTVIFGFQCDGYSHSWDYGAPWIHSKQPCDVKQWSTNAWHHIQVYYSRDDQNVVTYHSVWLDGREQVLDGTQRSGHHLGWAKGVVNTQFQIDGRGASGNSVVYLDSLTIYRW